MKRKRRQFLTFLLLASLAAALLNQIEPSDVRKSHIESHATATTVVNKQSTLSLHENCRPYGSRTAEIIALATDSGGQEHVAWKFTRGTGDGHTEGDNYFIKVTTLISGTSVCGTTFDPFIDEAITDAIELETARSLTLQMYQHFIAEAGGLEDYKEQLLITIENDNLHPFIDATFTSVDVWVWEQLGIEISTDLYTLEDIDDNYKYDESGPIGF